MVFTNGSASHAERVLEKLDLADIFEDVFHIASADYIPKPAPETFEKVVARFGIDPKVTCFFEDSEKNLAPAAVLGMTTVLIVPQDGQAVPTSADFVHHTTTDLAAFLAGARLKETAA
jgi:putative hydrolase of the HAD superfamily